MKNLYKQDFAGIETKFVWKKTNESAKNVKEALKDMQESVKNSTNKSLDELIKNNAEFRKTLEIAQTELNNFRKGLLSGTSKTIHSLSEKFVEEKIIGKIFTQETEKQKLRTALGLKTPTLDADDVLDLDEFAESQEFTQNNTLEIIYEILKTPSKGVPELEKFQVKLQTVLDNVSNDITKSKTGEISPETLYNNLATALLTEKLDVGKMLEEFAKLAKSKTENGSDNIDKDMQDLIAEYHRNPAEEKESASEMEDVYLANPELAAFLSEYYPPGFKDDIADYKTAKKIDREITIKDLPDFFLTTKLGIKSTKSLGESFDQINFDELKARVKAEYINKAQGANPLAEYVTDPLKSLKGKMKSSMPPVFRGLDLVPQDFKGVSTVEELFKNKMQVLLGINKGHNHTDKAGRATINLAGIEALTTKLDLENPAHIEMINRLNMGIPIKYEGEIGDKYRQALLDGKTRKDFDKWLDGPSKETGVKTFDKMGAWFKNIQYWLLKIGALLGWDGAEAKLKALEEKQEEKSDLHNKIQTAVDNNKKKEETINLKKQWETNPLAKERFRDFHTKNADLIKMGDFDELLGETSPEEFKKWDSTESREILKWAILQNPYHKVSIENWKILINEDVRLRSKTDKKGKVSHYLVIAKENMDDKEIHGWSDEDLEKSNQISEQDEKFNSLIALEIFNDTVTSDLFFKHKAKLFKNPNQAEDGTLKEPFAGLFALDKKFYTEKLSYNDLETLINKADRLSGGVKETDTMNSKYWTMKNNTVIKVDEKEEKETFEVDIKGEWNWNPFTGQAFDSMKALVERLKIK